DVHALGERSLAVEVALGTLAMMTLLAVGPRLDLAQRAEKVLLRPAVGEEHLHELLPLERRPLPRRLQPGGERLPPLGGDAVDGPGAAADPLARGLRVAEGRELFRLLEYVAPGPRPELVQPPVHLGGQLVRRPRPESEQAEESVRRGGRLMRGS